MSVPFNKTATVRIVMVNSFGLTQGRLYHESAFVHLCFLHSFQMTKVQILSSREVTLCYFCFCGRLSHKVNGKPEILERSFTLTPKFLPVE